MKFKHFNFNEFGMEGCMICGVGGSTIGEGEKFIDREREIRLH